MLTNKEKKEITKTTSFDDTQRLISECHAIFLKYITDKREVYPCSSNDLDIKLKILVVCRATNGLMILANHFMKQTMDNIEEKLK